MFGYVHFAYVCMLQSGFSFKNFNKNKKYIYIHIYIVFVYVHMCVFYNIHLTRKQYCTLATTRKLDMLTHCRSKSQLYPRAIATPRKMLGLLKARPMQQVK